MLFSLFPWLILLAVSATAHSIPSNQSEPWLAPYYRHDNADELVPNDYMVVLKSNETIQAHLDRIGLDLPKIGGRFSEIDVVFTGYHVKINSSVIHELVRRDPAVEFVQHTRRLEEQVRPEMIPENHPSLLSKRWKALIDNGAPFPVAMQSSAKKLTAPASGDIGTFSYWDSAGANVDIYILDSGIKLDHVEFGGRASNFRNWIITPWVDAPDDSMEDNDPVSHGTACATLAGGANVGTGKHANIINVKVKGPGNDWSRITDAINQVTQDHIKNTKDRNRRCTFAGSIISMSLNGQGGKDYALQKAINGAKKAGVVFVNSAGNYNQNAALSIPCNHDNVVCVAAVDRHYKRLYDSCFGSKITVSAPGELVKCGSNDGGYHYLSGTSMAAPYVAGILSHFMSYERLTSTQPKVLKRMKQNWNKGMLSGFDQDSNSWIAALMRRDKTPNTFINNGFEHRNKDPRVPYVGAPIERELRRRDFIGDLGCQFQRRSLSTDIEDSFNGTVKDAKVSSINNASLTLQGTITTSEPTIIASFFPGNMTEDASYTIGNDTSTTAAPKTTPAGGCVYNGCPNGYLCNDFGICTHTVAAPPTNTSTVQIITPTKL